MVSLSETTEIKSERQRQLEFMGQNNGEEEATQKKSSSNLHRADFKLCVQG